MLPELRKKGINLLRFDNRVRNDDQVLGLLARFSVHTARPRQKAQQFPARRPHEFEYLFRC